MTKSIKVLKKNILSFIVIYIIPNFQYLNIKKIILFNFDLMKQIFNVV